MGERVPVPRDRENDYTHDAARARALFAQERTGASLEHVSSYSFDPDNGDYYYSVTIPSLIVATYGGGTGLPTQRECLELLGCHGKGNVRKFAEIVAATVLCGELSLGSAIVAEEWVEAHDIFGRNR
jgi:hydroxymethylglutaryl-CoA reductase